MTLLTAPLESPPASPKTRAGDETIERVTGALDELSKIANLLASEEDFLSTACELVLPENFRLSVVIPVFNEARTIAQVVADVRSLPLAKEIIIVDDASTDGTRDILSQYESSSDVHVVLKPRNEGKGAALRTGFHRVSGDVVVVQDADREYDPRDILPLIRPIVCGEADVVFGSRYLGGESQGQSCLHRCVNRALTAASNWTTGLAVTDMETCYKAFRRDVLASFEINQPRFGFEPEVTAKLARRKFRLTEVPVRYSARTYAAGKKIGVKDLFNAVYCIARYAFWD